MNGVVADYTTFSVTVLPGKEGTHKATNRSYVAETNEALVDKSIFVAENIYTS